MFNMHYNAGIHKACWKEINFFLYFLKMKTLFSMVSMTSMIIIPLIVLTHSCLMVVWILKKQKQ